MKNLYFGKFPKMFKKSGLKSLLDKYCFQSDVNVLGPLWVSSMFGAGPEFC